MNRAYVLLLCLGVVGCTVHVHPVTTPATVTDNRQEVFVTVQSADTDPTKVSVTAPTTQPEPLPPPMIREEVVTVQEACPKFHWPEVDMRPPQAEFVTDILSRRDEYLPDQVISLLIDHIQSLRSYIDHGYLEMRKSYLTYISKCGYENESSLPESIYRK